VGSGVVAMETMNKCTAMETKLADMLLDPEAAPAKVKAHVAECDSCRKELEEMRATMAAMDAWSVPEPSPYFMTRLGARMREEREAPPQSWLQRLRARFMYGPPMHARPLAAMALTVMLLVGGGAYLGVTNIEQPQPPDRDAAVVRDLQTLDSNAQVLDQLEAISDNPNDAISDDPNSDDPQLQ
jgi:anti-sigma factor RsiW